MQLSEYTYTDFEDGLRIQCWVDVESDELVQETEINELLEDLEGKTNCM